MTDPREEIIRQGFAASNRGDREAALESMHPDVEIRTDTEGGTPNVYLGHEGWRDWNDSWQEVWDDFHWEVGEIVQHGDVFLVDVVSSGRGKGSGIELSQPLAWMITIPEDRATRIVLYRDRGAALEALKA